MVSPPLGADGRERDWGTSSRASLGRLVLWSHLSLPDRGDSRDTLRGSRLMPNPVGRAERSGVSPPGGPGWGQHAGLGECVLLLVLAPAGTARAALPHHGLAALVEDGLALTAPGGQ